MTGTISLLLGIESVRRGRCWWYRRYAPEETGLQKFKNETRKKNAGYGSPPESYTAEEKAPISHGY